MRELGTDLTSVKDRIKRLQGLRAMIDIGKGRGKTERIFGMVQDVYPAVFTICEEGSTSLRSFSYADVQTGAIRFFKCR